MATTRRHGPLLALALLLAGCLTPRPESRPSPPTPAYVPQAPPVGAAKLEVQPFPIDVAVPASEYPEAALAADAQATVTLKLLVDETGRVREAKALQDPGYGFGDAAMRSAIAHFRFSPGRVHGQPVATWWLFRVIYVLPS